MITLLLVQFAWSLPGSRTGFLADADRAVAGTVRTVRLAPYRRGVITEIVVDVDEVLMGTAGSTITVIQPYDGIRTASAHRSSAPHEGDAVVLAAAPWGVDSSRLQLLQYVRSAASRSGRTITVDHLGDWVAAADCVNGLTYVDVESLTPTPLVPRSPLDGPDPSFIAAAEAAAADWSAARAQMISMVSCLRAEKEQQ